MVQGWISAQQDEGTHVNIFSIVTTFHVRKQQITTHHRLHRISFSVRGILFRIMILAALSSYLRLELIVLETYTTTCASNVNIRYT